VPESVRAVTSWMPRALCAQLGPGGLFCELSVGHLGPHDFETSPAGGAGGRSKRARPGLVREPAPKKAVAKKQNAPAQTASSEASDPRTSKAPIHTPVPAAGASANTAPLPKERKEADVRRIPVQLPTCVKVHHLLKRKAGTTQHEMAAWIFHEMLRHSSSSMATTLTRSTASLFESGAQGSPVPFDAVAQMCLPSPPAASEDGDYPFTQPAGALAHVIGTQVTWKTDEYVLLDPRSLLKAAQKRPPDGAGSFPVSRSGFLKVSVLMVARDPTAENQSELFEHLLRETAPRWCVAVQQAGGFGCVLCLARSPGCDPYVAMLELYFHAAGSNGNGWADFEQACAGARGSTEARWVDPGATVVLKTTTEFVGFDAQ
jgi:hypothetical protein